MRTATSAQSARRSTCTGCRAVEDSRRAGVGIAPRFGPMREEAKNTSSRVCSRLAVLAVSVAGLLGAAPGTASAQVFFSEYVEDPGVGANKALEIYNGASTPVDLAAGGYAVRAYYNGSA